MNPKGLRCILQAKAYSGRNAALKPESAYPSKDGITQIRAIERSPEGDVRGGLQIAHGMVEFVHMTAGSS